MATRSFNNPNSAKRATLALVRASLFAGVFLGRTIAQSACDITELYKEDGWTIPGLAGATVESGHDTGQGDTIAVEILKPHASAASIMILSCVASKPGRVEIRNQAVNVLELRRYSTLGHTFAYGVDAEHVSAEGEGRAALGAAEVLMYYDLDGSGLFRLREYASRIPYSVRVPDWVKPQSGGR
jgi:hypothetical protein